MVELGFRLTGCHRAAAGPPPGDVTAPIITSSAFVSVAENAALAHTLTADEAVTWSIIGGADQARFELFGGSTLRWLANGVKDFEAPDDADLNGIYGVTVRATDLASNTADQNITVTVTDVAEGGGTPANARLVSAGNFRITSTGNYRKAA